MAIGDVPRFPGKFKPRGNELVHLLDENKITDREVLNNILSTLGTLRIDTSGMSMTGEFGSIVIDSADFKALIESANRMLDYLPTLWRRLKGHEILIRVGDKVSRLRLSLPPRLTSSSRREIEDSGLPAFEMPPGILYSLFVSYVSDLDRSPTGRLLDIKVRRAEELVGWLGEGWDFLVAMFHIATPASQLTTKESMDRLGESYQDFWDEVFTRCGV